MVFSLTDISEDRNSGYRHTFDRRLADDDRNQGEKSVDPQMLNAAMQGSPWCWLGFLPDKQIVCLPRILCARQAAASSKKSFDQICSGEVSLASSKKSIRHHLRSLRPTITTSPELSTTRYRHISPHINCGYAPDITTRLRRHTTGFLGSEPSLRSDMACITPWITISRNTFSPYRPVSVLENCNKPSTSPGRANRVDEN